ncbi:hypothetical protein GQ457_10G021950 [Hibiscus cannabinus]
MTPFIFSSSLATHYYNRLSRCDFYKTNLSFNNLFSTQLSSLPNRKTKMRQIIKILHELKPATLMVVVQVVFAGLNVLYKLAASDGMSLRIIVAYRFLFASAVMVPLALIIESRKRPKLTWTILVQAFLCALLGGSLAQNLYIESLALTSATFICAMTNLSPAITFIIAISIGLEKLALRTMAGKAKVVGTVIGIGGAMLLTFYKGLQFSISTHIDLLPNGHHGSNSSHAPSSHHLWAKMSEKYPCYYSSTALTCLFGAVQSVVYALCVERDTSQWKLGWDIRFLTVAYSGVFGMGLTFSMMSWCLRIKGPLYTSVFNPLVLVLVAIAGSLFLEEKTLSWNHNWISANCGGTLRCVMGEKAKR